jgi:hypothetical protein
LLRLIIGNQPIGAGQTGAVIEYQLDLVEDTFVLFVFGRILGASHCAERYECS